MGNVLPARSRYSPYSVPGVNGTVPCVFHTALHGATGLRPHQQPAAIEPLHPNAGKRPEQERDNLTGEADDAQQQRRMGETVRLASLPVDSSGPGIPAILGAH
jgi:hypothetical protein